ncbi:hypothetical protein [Propioniciclava soli]|uniref:hypothetical protein n=1 Tax=Propioniciclava soli TaxID=2775081 RepID=UPI001E400E33|nr:hypothetical protein [Propioniciclava soli]
MRRPADVAELKRAARALNAGMFATPGAFAAPARGNQGGVPADLSVVVVGVAGGVGASTVSLALAESAGLERLWDAAPTVASGLVGVCDRELRDTDDGWRQGRRGGLLVQRSPLDWSCVPGQCPEPPDGGQAVLDAGWDALSLRGAPGWVSAALVNPSTPLVLVTRLTAPGMRRLEVALGQLWNTSREVRVAITGSSPKHRWPREIPRPAALTDLLEAERVAHIPEVKALAVRGLDSQPVPAAVLAAVSNLH